MNSEQRKSRLIRFISDLEDEAFLARIEALVYGPEDESDRLMRRRRELLQDCPDNENARREVLLREFEPEERLKLALLLRLEDIRNHPEDLIDAETVFEKMRRKYKSDV